MLVQTRYDRFPATVKGAFVLRGGDANPHLVRVVRAGIDSVSGGAAKDIPMGHVDVDVAPGARPVRARSRPGSPSWSPAGTSSRPSCRWTAARSERSASRPFSVAWPRAQVRTGSVSARTSRFAWARPRCVVDRAELKSDRVILVWRPEGGGGEDESNAATRCASRSRPAAGSCRGAAGARAPSRSRASSARSTIRRRTAPQRSSWSSSRAAGDRSEIVRAPIG